MKKNKISLKERLTLASIEIRLLKHLVTPWTLAWLFLLIGLVGIILGNLEGLFPPPIIETYFSISPELIGIGITVILIEKAGERRKNLSTHLLRMHTYEAIANHICNIGIEIPKHFPYVESELVNDIRSGYYVFKPEAAKALENIAEILEQRIPNFDYQEIVDKQIYGFYDSVVWDLNNISDILLPRILYFFDDQGLVDDDYRAIDLLMIIETARRNIQHYLFVDRTGSMLVKSDLVRMTRIMASLYRHIIHIKDVSNSTL